jgi:3-oxoacyl-[acyl-carrier-protein] synthase-3
MRTNNHLLAYKATSYRIHAKIRAAGGHLPPQVLTNETIIAQYPHRVSPRIIERAIGVERRHVAADHESDSDLLAKAAQACLDQAMLSPDALSRILVTKYIGDHVLPMTAALVQRKLGCKTAVHSYDIDGGITAFCYAIEAANMYINSGDKHVLVVAGGVHNRYADRFDARVGFLFGDGAAAVLLSRCRQPKFLATHFFTDHQYSHMAKSNLAQSKPDQAEMIYNPDNYALYSLANWKEAEAFYLEAATKIVESLLKQSDLTISDIDTFLITENNAQMVRAICSNLGIEDACRISILATMGNLMSAMLPMQLAEGFKQ